LVVFIRRRKGKGEREGEADAGRGMRKGEGEVFLYFIPKVSVWMRFTVEM